MYCANNYYGKNCETFCNVTDYNRCDPETGALICNEGFIGEDCQIRKLNRKCYKFKIMILIN